MTTTLTTPEPPLARRRLRLRPAPPVDPPYDDELADGLWLPPVAAPQLPFEETETARNDPAERPDAPRPDLPCPRLVAAGLVQALMEVLAGRRPVQQLLPVTTEGVYRQLECRLQALRALRHRRGPASAGAARVVSVHVAEPGHGVAEVTAVTRRGDRHRAVALRLEGADGRWHCTALRLL